MGSKKKTAPKSHELPDMATRVKAETDRGAALIISAWLDDALTALLKASLVQDEKIIDEMFRPMGPLGSFSSKIRMAFLIGLIDRCLYDTMNTIREIRNDFAHSRNDLTFEESSIKDRSANLRFRPDNKNRLDTAREQFTMVALVLTMYCIVSASKIHASPQFNVDAYKTFLRDAHSALEKEFPKI